MSGPFHSHPFGLAWETDNPDEGTLSRAASPMPGVAGITPGSSPEFAAHTRPAGSSPTVSDYLARLGKPRASLSIRARVRVAARFFVTNFPHRSFDEVAEYLRGIDFSHAVKTGNLNDLLPAGSQLIQYQHAAGRPGNFFAKPGQATADLGIALGSRTFRRFRVRKGAVNILMTRTAPVSDLWTPGRTMNVYSPLHRRRSGQPVGRAGELVRGGGTQVVIPDPVARYVEPL